MSWTPPTYVEIKMDAEFSAYVDDLAPDLELAEPIEEQDREER
jgi:hypothetical protein